MKGGKESWACLNTDILRPSAAFAINGHNKYVNNMMLDTSIPYESHICRYMNIVSQHKPKAKIKIIMPIYVRDLKNTRPAGYMRPSKTLYAASETSTRGVPINISCFDTFWFKISKDPVTTVKILIFTMILLWCSLLSNSYSLTCFNLCTLSFIKINVAHRLAHFFQCGPRVQLSLRAWCLYIIK